MPNSKPVIIETINKAIIGLSFFIISIKSRMMASKTTSKGITDD
jgi:hypothetical protein